MRILLVVLPSGLCWNLWHEIGIQNTNVNKLYHSLQLLTSTNSYLDFKIILGGFSKIPPNLCGRLTALGLCERKMLTKISSKYCNYFLPHRQCELFALQSDTFLFSVSSHSEAALKSISSQMFIDIKCFSYNSSELLLSGFWGHWSRYFLPHTKSSYYSCLCSA